MTPDEQQAKAAVEAFYGAIEAMVSGKGLEPMRAIWHHGNRVTSGHPSGGWAKGWDEVWATWEVFASFGKAGRGGSSVKDLNVYVCGELAYSTCLFTASQAFGGETLACTNVLQRFDGTWKIVHHHVDKSPAMGAALEKLAEED